MVRHKLYITPRAAGKSTFLNKTRQIGECIITPFAGLGSIATQLKRGSPRVDNILVDEYLTLSVRQRKLIHDYANNYNMNIIAVATPVRLYDIDIINAIKILRAKGYCDYKVTGSELDDYIHNLITDVNCDTIRGLLYNGY